MNNEYKLCFVQHFKIKRGRYRNLGSYEQQIEPKASVLHSILTSSRNKCKLSDIRNAIGALRMYKYSLKHKISQSLSFGSQDIIGGM